MAESASELHAHTRTTKFQFNEINEGLEDPTPAVPRAAEARKNLLKITSIGLSVGQVVDCELLARLPRQPGSAGERMRTTNVSI